MTQKTKGIIVSLKNIYKQKMQEATKLPASTITKTFVKRILINHNNKRKNNETSNLHRTIRLRKRVQTIRRAGAGHRKIARIPLRCL